MPSNNEKRKSAVIVCSLRDPAGTNIRERLIEKYPFKDTGEFFDNSPIYRMGNSEDGISLVSSSKDIVFVEGLDLAFPGARCIFISRHRAESGIPSLTAHFTGNFGEANFGGNPREIARYSPSLLKNYIVSLNSRRNEIPSSYAITLEATHHGPTALNLKVLFVELGSTEKEWEDWKTARFIAESVFSAAKSDKTYNRCGIGIGGTHYPEKLTKMLIESPDVCLGPIVPKYALEYLHSDMLNQIVEKGDQKVEFAFVDSKGLGKFKEQVTKLLDESGLERVNI